MSINISNIIDFQAADYKQGTPIFLTGEELMAFAK